MHLLAVQAGAVLDGEEAIDLGQSPGDIVILSSNDTDLACLSAAAANLPDDFPSVRLANLLHLKHPLSVDLYVERVVSQARLVVVRLLGGRGYWPYGLDEIRRECRLRGLPFIALLDDGAGEAESAELTTAPAEARRRLAQFLRAGGLVNATNALRYAAELIGWTDKGGEFWREPVPVLDAGLFLPGHAGPSLDDLKAGWVEGAPVAAVIFYRALFLSGQTQAVEAMLAALSARGLNPLPIYVQSLKNGFAAELIGDLFRRCSPQVVLNATAFATAAPGQERSRGVLDQADAPVLQLVFAATHRAAWTDSARGLAARDLAMNVALPEVDGRILAGAVAFKAEARFDPQTECAVVGHDPDPIQIAHAADMATAWARLRRTSASQRRVALILANYPNRDARIGNGVGLDTPESAACVIRAMREAGYDVGHAPEDGAALMARLLAGPTNAGGRTTTGGPALSLSDYVAFLSDLDPAVGTAVHERWGAPQQDPFFAEGAFRLPLHRFGNLTVGIQPARGYNIDPKGSYHDLALVPPHGYLAFYAWLRRDFDAHAMVHMGKHGNLEWLPGKALALSPRCFPQAIAGATPQLYPFIVNDPGEGAQAKRRIGAVIIDHLTPPLTRAETYGPLRTLEGLVDEYYAAAGMDPRRLTSLRDDILALAASEGLDVDCGADLSDGDQALSVLDNYLCELKEMQIRDGLHVFSRSPQGRLRTDLLAALARIPRRLGRDGDASLPRALADDLGLDFDPLDCRLGDPWAGPRPAVLAEMSEEAWRTCGDTVERLEGLCADLIAGRVVVDPGWTKTASVLAMIAADLAPRVDACGGAEMEALLAGLDGRFVAPGPSGAPTRGRPEVLPTGRNFYSVDTRAVPTPTAWKLGWASAQMLVEDHLQRTGDYPRAVALSAWGTSNMRTGGDDVAQALALMGARPTWEATTGRVTGFEILPLAALGRPRVDVTVRISGFFRDAFVEQIDLLDSAARAVQALDEPEEDNPAAARFRAESVAQAAAGASPTEAARRAGTRVFGSRPGAYGAGLQAMIDEGLWEARGDLAEAYMVWGAYAYGAGQEGADDRQGLEVRLRQVDAVIHNQDNREHDLLDSDDYYQFEGGMTAAVEALKGVAPLVYHNDHSRPERPVIRTLEDEIARTLRARLVNPKWIAGVMRHGYKGAFEIAAGVDYLFAFAAATDAVKSRHFDLVHRAFIEDEAVRAFLRDANPAALRDVAARLSEAIERRLWTPRSNSAQTLLSDLMKGSP
ncbi:cobaltochelatase subunit CobN [Brevundimonas faecalis]|uniref:cobaltochelatase subunit CobN n=1 Tax=Brevundimonas faecalis TaxID=947378 RepID=UPI003617BBA5